MEGWRRKEAERQALVQQLQLDKHNLQQALESQHQVGRHPLLFIALDSYKTLYFCCILFPWFWGVETLWYLFGIFPGYTLPDKVGLTAAMQMALCMAVCIQRWVQVRSFTIVVVICIHIIIVCSIMCWYFNFAIVLRAKAATALACLSHRNSVCPSVRWVDQSKMVQARITKSLSLLAAWKILVLGTVKFFHKFKGGHPERGR